MDIFATVAAQAAPEDAAGQRRDESELLFVGSKQAGKSTVIHNFLMKDDAPKPTTALEYRFARRSTGAQNSVANIWELGGGKQLSRLLEVVLLKDRIRSCVVVITLDMSAPADALETLRFWLHEVRRQVGTAGGPPGARHGDVWAGHPDIDQVHPVGVPLVILAHKWDLFEEEFGSPKFAKIAAKVLRHFAHANGASLLCSKHKDKQIMTALRNLLYHHVFGTAAVRTVQVETSKPLLVPAGTDSFAEIGKPPIVEGVISSSPDERWAAAYEATFPPKAGKREAQDLAAAVASEQYAEECIDELRRQKHDELEKMRQAAKLAAAQAAAA
jgi:dynein light intermediate chain 2